MRFNFSSRRGGGWFKESYRHSLASKGIRTSFQSKQQLVQPSLEVTTSVPEPPSMQKIIEQAKKEARQDVLKDIPTRELSPVTEQRYAEARAAMAKKPLEDFLGRLKTGAITQDELNKFMSGADAGTKRLIVNAAFDGAVTSAKQGILVEPQLLLDAGLNDYQIKQIAQSYIDTVGLERSLTSGNKYVNMVLAERGVKGTAVAVGKRVGETVSAVEAGAEKEFQAELASGAQKFAAASSEDYSVLPDHMATFDTINKNQAKVRIDAYGDEVVDAPGVFNPLSVGGLDQFIKQREKSNKARTERMAASEKVDFFVNDIFRGKDDLAKIDLKPYNDGLKAYKKGDREGLMKAITDLEFENYNLKHKISLVDNIRQQILSNKNVTDTMLRGKDHSDSTFFNPLTSFGSGSAAFADQTNKMTKTFVELQKSSNEVSQRVAVLKRKLNKVNSLTQLDDAPPERKVQPLRNDNLFTGTPIEDGAGLLRHKNPALGKTNVLFNSPESLRLEDKEDEYVEGI